MYIYYSIDLLHIYVYITININLKNTYYRLNVCAPQTSYVEILTPKVTVWKAFGRCLGHEGRTLMSGIVLL